MPDDVRELLERQTRSETRLGGLERSLGDVAEELDRLARLFRGNGEHGLVGQVELAHERIRTLSAQWRWLLGLLVAVLLAVLKTLLVD